MGVKIEFNSNWDKFLNDQMAFAEQFPCPKCNTTSKRVAEKEFYCPSCDGTFKLNVEYVNDSADDKEIEDRHPAK